MLYLIDSSIYVFRAYYSLPSSMTDDSGNPVNAVYGFTNFLVEFLSQIKPEHVAAAFDISLTSSFRNDIYPAYKANRDPAPPELKRQFEYCRRIATELGFPVFADSTCEADDIIGTLACKWKQRNKAVTIVTRDKDLLQLVSKGDVYWDYANNKKIHHHQVKKEFGVRAEQVADYLAIAGDAVDNIKGVPGIGAKTARAIYDHFDSLDDLYQNLDKVETLKVRGAKSLQSKLVSYKEDAYIAQKLTQIKCDMNISAAKKNLRLSSPDFAALETTFDELGFSKTIRNRIAKLA